MTIDDVFSREELIEATKQVFAHWFSDRDKTVGMDAEYWRTADIADAVGEMLRYADISGVSFMPRNQMKWKSGKV